MQRSIAKRGVRIKLENLPDSSLFNDDCEAGTTALNDYLVHRMVDGSRRISRDIPSIQITSAVDALSQ